MWIKERGTVMRVDINKALEARIAEVDVEGLVNNAIIGVVNKQISESLKSYTEKKIEPIIDKEIKQALKKPVTTDNGWGETKNYDSFEDFFKKVFADKLKDVYGIQSKIDRAVKEQVSIMYEREASKIVAEIVKMLTGVNK